MPQKPAWSLLDGPYHTDFRREFFFWVFWTQQEKWHHCSTAVVFTCITLPVFWRSISCGRKQWKVLRNVSIKLWKRNFPLCDPVKKLSEFHDSVAVKPPVVAITDCFLYKFLSYCGGFLYSFSPLRFAGIRLLIFLPFCYRFAGVLWIIVLMTWLASWFMTDSMPARCSAPVAAKQT